VAETKKAAPTLETASDASWHHDRGVASQRQHPITFWLAMKRSTWPT